MLLLKTGFLRVCPRWGRAALYNGLITPKPNGGAYFLDLSDCDYWDEPAVGALFNVGAGAVALATAVEMFCQPLTWSHHLYQAPATVLLSVLGLRYNKPTLIAVQYQLGRSKCEGT